MSLCFSFKKEMLHYLKKHALYIRFTLLGMASTHIIGNVLGVHKWIKHKSHNFFYLTVFIGEFSFYVRMHVVREGGGQTTPLVSILPLD